MSKGKHQTQILRQAGASGKPEDVGREVGGVNNSAEDSWMDLWTLKAETRNQLKTASRDAACSHTRQRSAGPGDGSQEIETQDKVRKLQRTLYRKAKAEPKYRFWSLYGELARMDLLEHALKLVARNGGAPGIDGQTVTEITATEETKGHWVYLR
jgi:RNA-directed DNA polymerase